MVGLNCCEVGEDSNFITGGNHYYLTHCSLYHLAGCLSLFHHRGRKSCREAKPINSNNCLIGKNLVNNGIG